jgi:hypothetical protein
MGWRIMENNKEIMVEISDEKVINSISKIFNNDFY